MGDKMKKSIILIFIIIVLVLNPNGVLAGTWLPYDEIYMTSGNGTYDDRSTYN